MLLSVNFELVNNNINTIIAINAGKLQVTHNLHALSHLLFRTSYAVSIHVFLVL